jgi:cell division protein FtsZ
MLTQGLGAGSRPDTGKQAAIDDKEKIVEAIDGADMLFYYCRHGGWYRNWSNTSNCADC